MDLPPLRVLYEDNHCLALDKPAGVLTTHFQGTEETLDRQAKAYLKQKYRKPGNVFLGVVHRLDRPVSGVMLFARTSKAAARLSEQFRQRTVEKIYWAIVEGTLSPVTGRFEDWLRKDETTRRVLIVDDSAVRAQAATLDYRTVRIGRDLSLVELRPRTGRSHQLRIQLAHRGCPIYGDRKYGSKRRLAEAIALHARCLTFRHPVREEAIRVTADPPSSWNRFASLLDRVGP